MFEAIILFSLERDTACSQASFQKLMGVDFEATLRENAVSSSEVFRINDVRAL